MNTSIRHIGLVVNDIEISKNFWEQVMGFVPYIILNESGEKIDRMIGLKNVSLKTIKMRDENGMILELLKFYSHSDKKLWIGTPYSTGLTHIALNVVDIDDVINKIKHFGIKFDSEIVITDDSSAKVTYAKGPEGLLIELVEKI
tara:strand:+ start:393 stop:824 length:432 start_codon:yes stop_codon:yes gene_type:complete